MIIDDLFPFSPSTSAKLQELYLMWLPAEKHFDGLWSPEVRCGGFSS
jgi:hypothetical protein